MGSRTRRPSSPLALARVASAVMTDEDSETSASEAQAQDENELPIIQLCGLVEELRYQPAGLWGRPLLRV